MKKKLGETQNSVKKNRRNILRFSSKKEGLSQSITTTLSLDTLNRGESTSSSLEDSYAMRHSLPSWKMWRLAQSVMSQMFGLRKNTEEETPLSFSRTFSSQQITPQSISLERHSGRRLNQLRSSHVKNYTLNTLERKVR